MVLWLSFHVRQTNTRLCALRNSCVQTRWVFYATFHSSFHSVHVFLLRLCCLPHPNLPRFMYASLVRTSQVGVDIGCGMCAVPIDGLHKDDLSLDDKQRIQSLIKV